MVEPLWSERARREPRLRSRRDSPESSLRSGRAASGAVTVPRMRHRLPAVLLAAFTILLLTVTIAGSPAHRLRHRHPPRPRRHRCPRSGQWQSDVREAMTRSLVHLRNRVQQEKDTGGDPRAAGDQPRHRQHLDGHLLRPRPRGAGDAAVRPGGRPARRAGLLQHRPHPPAARQDDPRAQGRSATSSTGSATASPRRTSPRASRAAGRCSASRASRSSPTSATTPPTSGPAPTASTTSRPTGCPTTTADSPETSRSRT